MYTKVKTAKEIEAMRTAGRICSEVLALLKKVVKPGMSTKELADIAAQEIARKGAKPAFLGYSGFPDVICISLNEEVVHGIPSKDKTIKSGDIVSLDLGVTYDGMIVDSAISVLVGPVDRQKLKLLEATRTSLQEGVDKLRDGCYVGDISSAVEKILEKAKFGIVRDLVGHGVGHKVHEEPNIPNYGSEGSGPRLQAGMTIAIEPMATMGDERVYIDKDGWTVKTSDDSLSAHFEQTVLVTAAGHDILTPFL